jgi:hypothetical protein
MMFVDAGVSYVHRAPGRPSFAALYRPELAVLMKGRQTVRWNQALDLVYGQPFGVRSGFDAGYTYIDTWDPTRALAGNVFALPISSFREHAAAASVYRVLSRRNAVSARIDGAMTDVSALRRATGAAIDQNALAATLSFSRRMSERQMISGAYSLIKVSPYTFENGFAAATFWPSVPSVRGGISRYATLLASAAASQSGSPTGFIGGRRVFDVTRRDPVSLAAIAAATPVDPELPDITNLELFADPFHAVTLTYSQAWHPDFLVDVSGGVMRDTEMSYLFRMLVRKRIQRVWLSADFEHYPSNLAPVAGFTPLELAAETGEINGWSTFSVFGFRADGMLKAGTELSAGMTYSRGGATFLQNATTFLTFGVRLDHWVTNRWGVFAIAENYSSRFGGVLASTATSRQRFFGGVQVLLDPRVR